MSLETVPASRFDDAALADLFSRAYEGYFVPVSLDAAAFRAMASLQDISLEESPVLLRNGEPVAVAMLAVRGREGWIGGMGVVAGQRGAGLGRRVMDEALAAARRLGLHRVDLEVLVENTWASRIYEAMGFRDTRRLEVLERVPRPPEALAASPTVVSLAIEECLARHAALHAFERPPWQRGLAVLERVKSSVSAFGVRHEEGLRCSVVVRPDPKRTMLLDVGFSEHDPQAEALEATLRDVVPRYADSPMMLLNLEDSHPAAAILRTLGFEPSHAQREMSLAL